MPKPFPGMDPYLEDPAVWPDLHNALCVHIREELDQQLSQRYVARLEVRYVTDFANGREIQIMYPDVNVVEHLQVSQQTEDSHTATAVATVAAPVQLNTFIPSREKLTTIEIRETHTKTLVTIIEILSPVNKRANSPGREEYLQKRGRVLQSHAHLLEIDLLRVGERVPMLDPLPPAPYYVILSRVERRPLSEVWPIGLSNPLPVVPVPLLAPDPDVKLDLDAILTTVYNRSGYAKWINYAVPPPGPPLDSDAIAWIDEQLRNRGLR